MIIGNCPVCGAEMRVGTDMTNADRIRSMTDEELADWIFDRAKCQNCKELPCVKHDKGTDCRELWHDWLKQEVDDDTR